MSVKVIYPFRMDMCSDVYDDDEFEEDDEDMWDDPDAFPEDEDDWDDEEFDDEWEDPECI